MSQIMETMRFQASFFQNFLKLFPDRRLGEMASIFMCKYQVRKTTIIPGRANLQPMKPLLPFMIF